MQPVFIVANAISVENHSGVSGLPSQISLLAEEQKKLLRLQIQSKIDGSQFDEMQAELHEREAQLRRLIETSVTDRAQNAEVAEKAADVCDLILEKWTTLLEYVYRVGGEIVRLFRIPETASKTDERKTFEELPDCVKRNAHRLDGLLFYKVDRAVHLRLELEACDRGRDEIIDIAVKAFELSQDTRAQWVTADFVASQRVMAELGFQYEKDIEFGGLPHRF
jgi:hypothetical protein